MRRAHEMCFRLASDFLGLLYLIFGLPLCDRLPLHIARLVGASAFERDNMVNDMSGPAVRMAAPAHKFFFGLFTADDLTVTIPADTGVSGPMLARSECG